jgi:Zn-dependent alcohol dehydrogenase
MQAHAAVSWEQSGDWKIEEVDLDEPGPTEVLVEMAATGLCHSAYQFVTDGVKIRVPIVGGHRGSGIVRKVGSEVHDFAVGDHVVTSFLPVCGKCCWCAGVQYLCNSGAQIMDEAQPSGGLRMRTAGSHIASVSVLGAFADWQVYDQISIMKIDPEGPLDVACLVSCGVQTGYGSPVNAAQVRSGDVVMVIGAVGVGMNAVQDAALAGAGHVVVVDTALFKLEQTPKFGATETYADFDEAAKFVRTVTDWHGADSAITAVGVMRGEYIARPSMPFARWGKSAAVDLDDADVAKAAATLADASCFLSGQVCSSLSRIVVPRSRHDEMVDALAGALTQVRVGDPFDPQTQMGPLAMRRQRDRVENMIAAGVDEGARLVAGGSRPKHLEHGFFIEPTVFDNVDNSSTIAQNEIFGPVLTVIPARDESHAVKIANDTIYGLNASAFTEDIDRARKVAGQLRSGTVGHNAFRTDFRMAFGGFKQSGIGREGGKEGLLPYFEIKAVILDGPPEAYRA